MKIIPSTNNNFEELPLKLKVSFSSIYDYLIEITQDKSNPYYSTAIILLKEFEKHPELKDGLEDLSRLKNYSESIDKLLDILFPSLLETNEIKAATIPFEFTTFKFSKRFENILDNAGEDYKLELRNFEENNMYILTCTFILSFCYGININFNRPILFEIPDNKTGIKRHYRALFNGDFFKVKPLENAVPITDEDVQLLIDNFDNLEIWKEKFPPNSYEFTGFGMMNLFDVTSDQNISNLSENLLRSDEERFSDIEQSISSIFGSTDIKFGISAFLIENGVIKAKNHKTQQSFILDSYQSSFDENFFCKLVEDHLCQTGKPLAISNVELYGERSNFNGFYKKLKEQNIQSIILVPLKFSNEAFGILEFISPNKHELNSITANKLHDIIPVFKVAIERYMDEYENKLESIIQANYTALHPTVKWRFSEEAEKFLYRKPEDTTTKLNDIIFEGIYPLYGQTDIKGSSHARNVAIEKDLIQQLNLAHEIIEKAENLYKLPIYRDLLFRIEKCIKNTKKGLNTGDEISLTTFLKNDIYPVFNHLKEINDELKIAVENYTNLIDSEIHVIYNERKKYEDSVTKINEELSNFLDAKQVDAQSMFPHYFERYKTDGIEYNMYIGQSLVQNNKFDKIYLHNLRLWQLQMMCELENIAFGLKNSLSHPLQVTSLILVHSNPLAIKFRMDEKRFDVNGAYNIRYEIIKKRIDKAMLKDRSERLTQPGKIAIVYGHESDAIEYKRYIEFLQSKGYLKSETEYVELEDLQDLIGLQAIRVSVNYNKIIQENVAMNELLEFINGGTSN